MLNITLSQIDMEFQSEVTITDRYHGSLPELNQDSDRFLQIFTNEFSKTCKRDELLRKIVHHFDTSVNEKLVKVFPAEEEFNVLGVGVGQGRFWNLIELN